MSNKQRVEEEVANWLKTEGYRIEFETARAFERQGLSVMMGKFVGPETTKRREIDVCANHTPQPVAPNTLSQISLICECKYLQQPWVMLYGSNGQTWRAQFLTTAKTQTLAAMGANPGVYQALQHTFHFHDGRPVAHSVLQALKQGGAKDRAYETMMRLVDVSCMSADELDEINAKFPSSVHAIFLPLAVVDGPLLAASYGADPKDLSVNEVPWGRVWWMGGRRTMLIDIVQLKHIDEYVAQAAESAILLGNLMVQFLAGGTDA